jgi:acyl-coenzyme A synthetase/AMP-(fatty) acid ligase
VATGWGTREIEKAFPHGTKCAVGVADALKGQVAMAFVVLKDVRDGR